MSICLRTVHMTGLLNRPAPVYPIFPCFDSPFSFDSIRKCIKLAVSLYFQHIQKIGLRKGIFLLSAGKESSPSCAALRPMKSIRFSILTVTLTRIQSPQACRLRKRLFAQSFLRYRNATPPEPVFYHLKPQFADLPIWHLRPEYISTRLLYKAGVCFITPRLSVRRH